MGATANTRALGSALDADKQYFDGGKEYLERILGTDKTELRAQSPIHAVKNIEDIVSVDGIDGVSVGPTMSHSQGLPPVWSAPERYQNTTSSPSMACPFTIEL